MGVRKFLSACSYLILGMMSCTSVRALEAAPPTSQEKRVALVIGISAYDGTDKEGNSLALPNSAKDALAMSKKLEMLGFSVIRKENLKSSDLNKALMEFQSLMAPGAVAALYFSGHGLQVAGRNYLLLQDADQSSLKSIEGIKKYSLALDDFLSASIRQKPQNILVWLDACRNNPFSRQHNTTGLAEVTAPAGSLVALSTKPGGYSWDLDGIADNSLFTKHLLNHIDKSNVPVDQVMKVVNRGVFQESKSVAQTANDIQEPWIQSSLYDDLFLRQSGPIRLLGNEQADTAAWFSIKDSGSPSQYQSYILEFPQGKFLVDAKARLAALSSVRPDSVPQRLAPPFDMPAGGIALKLASPAFMDELGQFIRNSDNPMEQLELALKADNPLAKAWWCAAATHERYRFPVRAQDAIRHCQDLSRQGIPVAMYLLGRAHLFGRGVPQDDAKAISLFRSAAEKGNAIAQNILGDMYFEGRGVPRNSREAVSWYTKSAQAGHAAGQTSLGVAYASGQGVVQDEAKAAQWYLKAANQGDTWAQNNLGAMLLLGKGIPRDFQAAFNWINRSANQGNVQAWLLMGSIYEAGAGRDRNVNEALRWYRKAMEQASEDALRKGAAKAIRRLDGRG